MLPDGWKKVSLKEIATIKDGAHKTPNYTASGVPFLRVTDIKADSIDLSSVKFISYEEHLNLIKRCKPEPGDILYSKNGTIGIPCLIDWDWEFSIFVSLALIKLTKKEIIFTQYLVHVLASDLIKEEIRLRAKTGTVTNLHLEEIKEFKILLPPLTEQKKIAAILSSVDKAIAKTQAVIDQTRKVKQGLLQQLLTRGIGHTKFKDSAIGKIPESWEVKPLGVCFKNLDHKRVPIKESERSTMQGNVPYYGASGVIDWINKSLFNEKLLLLAEDGMNLVYRNRPIAYKIEGLSFVNNHAHVYQPTGILDVDLAVEILCNMEISSYVVGSYHKKINKAQSDSIPMPVPPLCEQNKIASVIYELNNCINNNDKKVIQLKTLKNGLMQDLLTGRVRV